MTCDCLYEWYVGVGEECHELLICDEVWVYNMVFVDLETARVRV